MTTAAEEGVQLMQKMIASGEAKDNGEAYILLNKRYPALRQRYLAEGMQRIDERPAPPPLSYAERLAKQQEGSRRASEVIARRVEAEIHASGTTKDKALSKVIHDDPLLWERYRDEQLFSRRG